MKIITHNGSCHFDEYLAIALVVGKYKVPENEITIYRRPPTEKELDDPNVWVIDVGKKHEPEKRNFDHHQYSGGDSSFILIAKYIGINDICSKLFKWWYPSNEMDTIGPKRFAENLGVDKEIYYQFQAPIQGFLLKKFERKPNDIITKKLLLEFGDNIYKRIEEFKNNILKLEREVQIKRIKGIKVLFHNIENVPNSHIDYFQEKYHPDATVGVCPDNRGPGLLLYKLNNNPLIDFLKLEGMKGIAYINKKGLFARTKYRSSNFMKYINLSLI